MSRCDGRCTLPCQERLALGRGELNREGGFASTRHTVPFQEGEYGSFGHVSESKLCSMLPRTPHSYSRRVTCLGGRLFLSSQRKERGEKREHLLTGLERQKKSQWRDVHWLTRFARKFLLGLSHAA